MKKILNQYIDCKNACDEDLPLAPYKWSELDPKLSFDFAAYSQFLEEHALEIANVINELGRYILDLSSWKQVIDSLDDDEQKLVVIGDFISPVATIALNLPYVIRSRFIYSVSHLSHQANKVEVKEWKDDFPIDKEVYFNTADKYGKPWGEEYKKFKLSLEDIANKKYCESTGDFRNTYNHRFSRRIEIGHTGFVTRIVDSNRKISYGFGCQEPLMLKDIIPLLKKQHKLCLDAFSHYQKLVNTQSFKINKVNRALVDKLTKS